MQKLKQLEKPTQEKIPAEKEQTVEEFLQKSKERNQKEAKTYFNDIDS